MNKTVLITGASGGIGAKLSEFFVQHGYIVIGTYHSNEYAVHRLSQELGRNFYYYKCDLSDFNNARGLITKITNDGLNIDILINNAGISIVGLLQDISADTWNTLWNTNVTSVISLSKEIIPLFLKRRSGIIINISSVWGNCGASCETAYSATKGAINAFTKALAKELAPSDIQVNAISCGIIDTTMNKHLTEDDLAEIADDIPCGRIGTPLDVAKAAYAIVNSGKYLTGQIITVDGGWTI